MALQNIIKGEIDWHNKVNANFESVLTEAEQIARDVAANDRVPKPVGQTLTEGYLYQQKDGSTKLMYKEDDANKFKFSILVDNGADGTPEAIEYLDDCYGFTPMTMNDGVLDEGDWAGSPILDCFMPCVVSPNSGLPVYFLNKNKLSEKIDGTPADLTGADGDVMIQVSQLFGRVTKVGNKAKISIMNFKESDDCFCFNDIGGVIKPYTYRGRYKGSYSNTFGGLCSVSGVPPLTGITRAEGRAKAIARGTELSTAYYHQNNPYLVFLWEYMFMLLFKTRNSQKALGKGRVNTIGMSVCGWSDTLPWTWGTQSDVGGIVFLGIEDFYGNIWEWVDGIVLDHLSYKLTRDPSKYSDTGSGYEIMVDSGLKSYYNSKFVTMLNFTNDLCCLPKSAGEAGSSNNTFFCDYLWVADSSYRAAKFGGDYTSGDYAGAFYWNFSDASTKYNEYIGTRLCLA